MWDQRYSENEWAYGSEPNDFLAANFHHFPRNGHILSLGEGDGRNALFLAQKGYKVTALDSCETALKKLAHRAAASNFEIETIHCDLADYQFEENHWDGVLSIWCHLPKDLRKKVHSQIPLTLKPGGVFILEAYNHDQLKYKTGGPPVIDMLMSISDLKKELGGLEFDLAGELVREISEGPFHQGQSAVSQVLAHKSR